MQELIDRALDAAERSGASYADIRLVERESESVMYCASFSAP